jgi:hypothetical protein
MVFAPYFFAFIGGIITWLALRNDDPRKAKDRVIAGIISSALESIFILFLRSLASAFGYSGNRILPHDFLCSSTIAATPIP